MFSNGSWLQIIGIIFMIFVDEQTLVSLHPDVVTFIDFVYAWSFQILQKKGTFQHYVREHFMFAILKKGGWFPERVLEISIWKEAVDFDFYERWK